MNRQLCKGYGVVFCFAKSPLTAMPPLTHQPVPALWRLSLKRLNRLFITEIKKRPSLWPFILLLYAHFSLSFVYAVTPFSFPILDTQKTHPKGLLQFTSRKRIWGSPMSAMAILSRRCQPPDNLPAFLPKIVSKPNCRASAAVFCRFFLLKKTVNPAHQC